MIHGITSSSLGVPEYRLAVQQHKAYISALRSLGLNVTVLPPDSSYPDSTFVEDVALCTPEIAIVTSPGAVQRRGEEVEMEEVLRAFYDRLERISYPGTLDGGDVMMAGNHFFIGISARTNINGAEQLIRILEKHGMTGEKVTFQNLLHLKTGVSYIENDTILATGELSEHPSLKKFWKIIVPPEESYAANAVWINGSVLLPKGYPHTLRNLEANGFPVILLDVSEFRKLDGGLSCLSLRF